MQASTQVFCFCWEGRIRERLMREEEKREREKKSAGGVSAAGADAGKRKRRLPLLARSRGFQN